MSEAPRAVREAALSAFDTRRPGTPVLDLVRDLPLARLVGNSEQPPFRELRFGQSGSPVVTMRVTDTDGSLLLAVLVDPAGDVEYRIEVSNVSGAGLPAVQGHSPFEVQGVLPGLTSLLLSTGPAGSPDEQRWQTAWVRL